MNAPNLVQEVINRVGKVRLLAVQQISKLFYSETTIGIEDRNEFSRVVSRLKELCSINQISLVASCSAKKKPGLPPEPMGGSYLRHTANVIVYLRGIEGEEVSAHLVKHFEKRRIGKRVRLNGDGEELGRITRDSMRGRIQDTMKNLRGGYREALKEDLMQRVFDEVWEDWDNEQGAMIYSKVVSAMDLLNLTGVLANRREIMTLRSLVEALENRDAG
jgi:hypothetical protein